VGATVIVVDTNVIVNFHFPGPATGSAERTFAKDPAWVAPLLWRSEFRNTMMTMVRANHLELRGAKRMMAAATKMMDGGELAVSSDFVLDLATDSGCSAYDCEFVSVSRELSIPLVTENRKILNAFPDSTVSLKDFTSL
jgi:predicted nucleic acid-binding protein